MPHSKDLAETTWGRVPQNSWACSVKILIVIKNPFKRHENSSKWIISLQISGCENKTLFETTIYIVSWRRRYSFLEHVNVQYRFTQLAAVRLAGLRKHNWCSRIFSCLKKIYCSFDAFWFKYNMMNMPPPKKTYQMRFHMLPRPIEIGNDSSPKPVGQWHLPSNDSLRKTSPTTHLDPRAWERHKIFPNVVTDQDTKVRSEYPAETPKRNETWQDIQGTSEMWSISFHNMHE